MEAKATKSSIIQPQVDWKMLSNPKRQKYSSL